MFTEIINLQAILNLPKGTEHFMSDLHGEYEAFLHILNNCSGVVREHVDVIFGDDLQAILNLPKGTEHFMSDLHGEYEAFLHILNNCSGVVREHVDVIFGDDLSEDEKGDLCTLIYYPHEKLELVRRAHMDTPAWYKLALDRLLVVARSLSSRYTRSKVRKAIPRDYAYIIDELLHTHPDENNYRVRYHERIIASILETDAGEDFICSLSSYTRSKVRKAIPRDYAYIIDELLHTHPDENNYRVRYHERIIASILETDAGEDFICSLSSLIKRLVIDHLHLVGDIFDRGGGAAKIMDRLGTYHSFDIQWGNHDLLWMGAAAGQPACIITVLRNNLRYGNYEILENDYGISLRELVAFAERTYEPVPEGATGFSATLTPLMKAVNVLLFKLEGQIIQRHACFDMHDRLLLERIDASSGMVRLPDGRDHVLATCDFPTVDFERPYELDEDEQRPDGRDHVLATCDFPTVDFERPYELDEDEQRIVDKLVAEFTTADHLHRHINLLYSHGSMYLAHNHDLLFHGCVPMNDDGTFSSMNCLGTWRSGRDYLDFCDEIARRAWRTRDQDALDWMWYLWIGMKSPASGRLVKTFERTYVDDPACWVEPMDPYFELTRDEGTCEPAIRTRSIGCGTCGSA